MIDDYDDDEIDYIDESTLAEVPVAWEALEDAFENNAHEVHSYLHLNTGEVIRVVDGVADPAMHNRIMSDRDYMRVDPVSSREQYRWMERFIATVDDDDLSHRLMVSIDGKGAFRRFKDALMNAAAERERWFTFRSERLRANMESWLAVHGIRAIDRPQWEVPVPAERSPADRSDDARVEEEEEAIDAAAPTPRRRVDAPTVSGARPRLVDSERVRLHELVDSVAEADISEAETFLQFLISRSG